MDIRPATIEDIPALLDMGQQFADALDLPSTVGYSPETMATLFAHLINDDGGILLITEGGAAGGMIHPSIFNAGHITGQELFWWVNEGKRGRLGIRLLDALEKAAQDKGADSWMMVTMERLNFKGAGKLYERRGYKTSDMSYIKVF